MRKLDFCLSENKGADQLCSNCTADQCFCFRYSDSTLSLLVKLEISSFKHFSVTVQAGLWRTWWETLKTGFLTVLLIFSYDMSLLMRKSTIWVSGQVDTY